jgi:large subunit ribosomal protein L25
MKKTINLQANNRDSFGTSFSRNLRLKNKIPAIIYGEKEDNENVIIDENQINKIFKDESVYSSLLNLDIEGKTQKVLIKEIQRHQYKNKILHIDFQRVKDDSVISTKIPIIFSNTKNCAGVKYGGRLNIKMVDVKIICKAKDLPESLKIDLLTLNMNERICLSDVKEKGNITFSDEKKGFNRIIVSIKKRKQSEIEKTETSEDSDKNKIENATK